MNSNQRKPIIALIMSLMMPGLGQIYNGDLTKGLCLFLTFVFISPIILLFGLLIKPLLWLFAVLSILFALGIYILCVIDAYKTAKRIGDNFQLGPYNRPYFYLATLFFCYFFVQIPLQFYIQNYWIQMFKIPSTSMEPTVLQGDRILVNKRVNSPTSNREIKHGDLAVFIYPNNRTMYFIKRIIGLPGDEIVISKNEIFINGKSISEGKTYSVVWNEQDKVKEFKTSVPNGYVFALGDNRSHSVDSRSFGPIPLVDVVGIAEQVVFSANPKTGWRWDRIGKRIY